MARRGGGVDAGMRARIEALLERIELEHGVRILFAVESGSRAWGCASADSDWDVRFVYARPAEYYLSLAPRRDVIELPIEDGIDAGGWDIRKALSLLLNANPTLLEWLKSPIVYRRGPVMAKLARLAERTGHRQRARHHYLRIGRSRFEDRIEGHARPALKAYFYSLRPALALCWERAHARGRVPMDLPTLLAGVDLSASLRAEIDAMLAHKAVAPEQGTGARMPEIDAFMQEEFGLAAAGLDRPPAAGADLLDRAQALFLATVTEVFVFPARPRHPMYLIRRSAGGEEYVFHLEPAFDSPTLVRVRRNGGGAVMDASHGRFSRHEARRVLSDEEWTSLAAAVAEAGFWSLPEADDDRLGLDGETWMIEGRQGDRRHRIVRWCPTDEAVIRLGRLFLDLPRWPGPIRRG